MIYILSILVGGIAVALGMNGKFVSCTVFFIIALILLFFSRA